MTIAVPIDLIMVITIIIGSIWLTNMLIFFLEWYITQQAIRAFTNAFNQNQINIRQVKHWRYDPLILVMTWDVGKYQYFVHTDLNGELLSHLCQKFGSTRPKRQITPKLRKKLEPYTEQIAVKHKLLQE